MQEVNDRLLAQFQALLEEANVIMSRVGFADSGGDLRADPPASDYMRFRTRSLNLIRRACGEASDHYHSLRSLAEDEYGYRGFMFMPRILGVVQAAFEDYKDGLLVDLRSIVAAEVLDDFMEQAAALHQAGFYAAAISLAGAVLEGSLRKLSDKLRIEHPERTKIELLNVNLRKAEAYPLLVQKQITALADLRNSADHGHFDQIRPEDAADMVRWIRRFLADYLT